MFPCMARRAAAAGRFLGVCATVALAAGCGTIGDLRAYDLPHAYGGVRLDVFGPPFNGRYEPAHWITYRDVAAVAIDIPVSFVADTLVLPITIPCEIARHQRIRAAEPEPADDVTLTPEDIELRASALKLLRE